MKLVSYQYVLKAIVLSVALAFSSSTFAAETKSSKTAKANSTKAAPTTVAKKAPSWLFVLQAKKGTITKTDKKGVYTLTIKHSDMGPAIAFTDRPDRIVKKITPEQLKKIWNKGPNSFEKDPPNSVLSAAGVTPRIVILNGDHVSTDTVSFSLSTSHKAGGELESLVGRNLDDVVVTVDGYVGDSVQHCTQGIHCPYGRPPCFCN